MNDQTDVELLDSIIRDRWEDILFAIVAIKDKDYIFSIAFFDRFLTEDDFKEMRLKLEQDKPDVVFSLRMAYLDEMEEARRQHLQNDQNFDLSTYNFNTMKH